ncbi:MAG: hypothetical protein M1830_000099 [Pleopsidium flavum]|nr:MAG: hypothetical protein M1830_000099 [Pleopsidium flavum]
MSYLVRWVNVKGEHTISWSVQPHKKSINFGLFRHPGTSLSIIPNASKTSTFEAPPIPGIRPSDAPKDSPSLSNSSSAAIEKLKSIGLILVSWYGKCEADKVSTGTYDVPPNSGAMYALVFDNTFSKQTSKTATFVLLTYPTNTPPQFSHHMHHLQATSTSSDNTLHSKPSPRLTPIDGEPTKLLGEVGTGKMATSNGRVPLLGLDGSSGSDFYTGVLRKRRRKRHQGYARRFFSLDYISSTLSYYHNRKSCALRGAIPLSLAVVGANATSREISIDSGAEVWHLKARNQKEFEGWVSALERASKTVASPILPLRGLKITTKGLPLPEMNAAQEREWARVEGLVGRVAGSRDAVWRLAKDTDPKYLSHFDLSTPSSTNISPMEPKQSSDYFAEGEGKRPFWKCKPSNPTTTPTGFRRSVSTQLAVPAPPSIPPISDGTMANRAPSGSGQQEQSMHEHCMAILRDLDLVVAEFAALIAESKQRRMPVPASTLSRLSTDSIGSEEFFDADDGNHSQLLMIRGDSDEEAQQTEEDLGSEDDDVASSSDVDGVGSFERNTIWQDASTTLFPHKPKSLIPLPVGDVTRRITIPAPTVLPPSLIGFLRKNVGKDLSTISMPVSANEPISLLQRSAEQLEYTSLLDAATTANADTGERLLYITAFAISSFSNARVKERAIRKPFNPMLGETFELVREDKGFRFIAEKVSHRPVRMACQGESKDWTFAQSPMPTQKFWGKSAELNTDGRIRVVLHATDDRYGWTTATCFLRNIIAGEKYVEPVGTMTIVNETTNQKAVVTFKSKGMFSGRSEDVLVQTLDAHGSELLLGLAGKWTSHLTFTENGTPTSKIAWEVGDLVSDASKHYGLTTFAASLNQITHLEKDKIPAQTVVSALISLEEAQRRRRTGMEERGEAWVPRWFTKVEGGGEEEVWRLKSGMEGYWEERAVGKWEGVVPVFDV